MKIGYARVSTEEQNLGLQRDALEEAGLREMGIDLRAVLDGPPELEFYDKLA